MGGVRLKIRLAGRRPDHRGAGWRRPFAMIARVSRHVPRGPQVSGPWDRPSSPDPDDRDSAAQDRESPPDNAQSAEPRAPTDPWGESSSSEPGWDVWPPPSPPPDDYYSEPESSHDLWSEPWEEEAAAMGAGAPDVTYEPAPLDPPVLEPAPVETAPLEQPAAPAFDEPRAVRARASRAGAG